MKMTAGTREAVADFAELVAKAFFGGLVVAVALGIAILVLSPSPAAPDPASPQGASLATLPPDAGTALPQAPRQRIE
jgi:hypothetical protein